MIGVLTITMVEFLVVGLAALLLATCAGGGLLRRNPFSGSTCDWRQFRINLFFFVGDPLVLAPFLYGLTLTIRHTLDSMGGLGAVTEWGSSQTFWVQLGLSLVVSDFVGYWRHRLMHSSALWPFHTVHHSDPSPTFLTLSRFHPVNRLIAVVPDALVLTLLGFQPAVVLWNGFGRHYYGYFVHMNLPWGFGLLGKVFVSPRMHRWHHATESEALGKNFATLFAFFDVWFGTWYLPASRPQSCGAGETSIRDTIIGQLIDPFLVHRKLPRSVPLPPIPQPK